MRWSNLPRPPGRSSRDNHTALAAACCRVLAGEQGKYFTSFQGSLGLSNLFVGDALGATKMQQVNAQAFRKNAALLYIGAGVRYHIFWYCLWHRA